jgi:type II secretory pathway pseudopilin PulG
MAAEVGLVFALTQVETVGLWVGLVSAIVSIVLSIVAIAFARDVDRRSLEISHQTIRSLEAIQSAVQRLSEDTGGLIKVAWERMLGSMGPGHPTLNSELETLFAGCSRNSGRTPLISPPGPASTSWPGT